MANLIAFPYYGGKNSHLSWLLPLLPDAGMIKHYCEPFGGSAAVLLNREPALVETYNDLDEMLVTFFRVLRDYPDELFRLLNLTPYSRWEFENSRCVRGLSDIERARRFYVHIRQVFGGKLIDTSSWGRQKVTSNRGMSKAVSGWWSGIDKLVAVTSRLLRVQIECLPAIDVIRNCDTPDTLFYCDPPYVVRSCTSQMYRYEYSEEQHIRLAKALNEIEGLAAVSGYRCDLLDVLYHNWRRYDAKPKKRPMNMDSPPVVESLWMNYDME